MESLLIILISILIIVKIGMFFFLLKIKTEYPLLHLGLIERNNLPQEVLNKLEDSPYLLIDPLGNGILLYDLNLPSGELLKDLKKLLQNSKIG